MNSRKQVHKEACKDEALGICRFIQESCYLNHQEGQRLTKTLQMEDFRLANYQTQPPGASQTKFIDPAFLMNVLKQVAQLLQPILSQ